MQRISSQFGPFQSPSEVGFSSSIINNAIAALPTISDDIVRFLEKINPEAARNDEKYTFFRESEETDGITDRKLVSCLLNIWPFVGAYKL